MSRPFSMIGQTPFYAVRADGFSTFIPATVRSDGKPGNSQLIVNCYANARARRDGSPGRTMRFTFSLWGALGVAGALAIHKGMALDILGDVNSYPGRKWITDANGNRVAELDASGAEIKTWKVGFNVAKMLFAEESQEFIDYEISTGLRPQFWNVKSHQHWGVYAQMLKDKAANKPRFNPQAQTFGFAKVYIPAGKTIDWGANEFKNYADATNSMGTYHQPGNGRPGYYIPNAEGNMQQQVGNAVNNQYGQQMQQGQMQGYANQQQQPVPPQYGQQQPQVQQPQMPVPPVSGQFQYGQQQPMQPQQGQQPVPPANNQFQYGQGGQQPVPPHMVPQQQFQQGGVPGNI